MNIVVCEIKMFVSEYFGFDNELNVKNVFDCILDKDSLFFINLKCVIQKLEGI